MLILRLSEACNYGPIAVRKGFSTQRSAVLSVMFIVVTFLRFIGA
jgi:hypothetical protein